MSCSLFLFCLKETKIISQLYFAFVKCCESFTSLRSRVYGRNGKVTFPPFLPSCREGRKEGNNVATEGVFDSRIGRLARFSACVDEERRV